MLGCLQTRALNMADSKQGEGRSIIEYGGCPYLIRIQRKTDCQRSKICTPGEKIHSRLVFQRPARGSIYLICGDYISGKGVEYFQPHCYPLLKMALCGQTQEERHSHILHNAPHPYLRLQSLLALRLIWIFL